MQLDMRLANADRNGGNILATKCNGSWTLTPIDHGYTLPSSLQVLSSGRSSGFIVSVHHSDGSNHVRHTLKTWSPAVLQDICFEWLNWPQAHVPFSAETTAYIAALDAEADLATLAEHGLVLRSECKRVFRATTMCLKLGAAAGLTPYAIGSIMCGACLPARDPCASLARAVVLDLTVGMHRRCHRLHLPPGASNAHRGRLIDAYTLAQVP